MLHTTSCHIFISSPLGPQFIYHLAIPPLFLHISHFLFPTKIENMSSDTPTTAQADIERERDDYEDSALGSDAGSSLTSIGSSILKYRTENGRTYHSSKEGNLQHHLYALTFGNKLQVCPLPEKLDRVLDIGTGTGIWASYRRHDRELCWVARQLISQMSIPRVLGIDLSLIQPTFIPPNCSFQIDDVEEFWTIGHKFDFIHRRMMTGSIRDGRS
ncbi:hypothetical protein BKA64DRAFT_736767 [Cadophora sp. MPI-SDFR-AT-0126]|nr:hypothetical protein BKA64DRAFT_736767 [Leotiomycetes sp. MPI-SDFR-AT-0126]